MKNISFLMKTAAFLSFWKKEKRGWKCRNLFYVKSLKTRKKYSFCAKNKLFWWKMRIFEFMKRREWEREMTESIFAEKMKKEQKCSFFDEKHLFLMKKRRQMQSFICFFGVFRSRARCFLLRVGRRSFQRCSVYLTCCPFWWEGQDGFFIPLSATELNIIDNSALLLYNKLKLFFMKGRKNVSCGFSSIQKIRQ